MHIRAFYAVYNQIHVLDNNVKKLDPLNFGYYKTEKYLIPKMLSNNVYPLTNERLPSFRNCKNCSRKNCHCVQAGVSCITFCSCQRECVGESVFQNKFSKN